MSKRQPAADRGDDPSIKHGTVYAHEKRGCRCPACKDAAREWRRTLPSRQPDRLRRRAAEGRPIPASAHGTVSGWSYWRCACDACKEHLRATNAKQLARRQAETSAGASNSGKPWTEDELAILAMPDLPDLEAAKMLGRTAAAVTNRRYLMRQAGQLDA